MIEQRFARSIAEKAIELGKRTLSTGARGAQDHHAITLAADLRSYFIYLLLDCNREEALELSLLLDTLGALAHYEEDIFDAGFFTALARIASCKYEGEAGRNAWNERLQLALRELGIKASGT